MSPVGPIQAGWAIQQGEGEGEEDGMEGWAVADRREVRGCPPSCSSSTSPARTGGTLLSSALDSRSQLLAYQEAGWMERLEIGYAVHGMDGQADNGSYSLVP